MSTAADEYERFTRRVIEELIGTTVHHQRTYTGRVSGRDINVDVSFDYYVGGARLLFLVECKCYRHKVTIDEIEEFHSKIDDIGAHRGIMVTTVGFQDGAVRTAQGRGIALALLTKAGQPGELRYVVMSAGAPRSVPEHEGFWQGNLRGPLDRYEGGFRFETMGQFLGMLCLDAQEEQRKAIVAAWEREHGNQ